MNKLKFETTWPNGEPTWVGLKIAKGLRQNHLIDRYKALEQVRELYGYPEEQTLADEFYYADTLSRAWSGINAKLHHIVFLKPEDVKGLEGKKVNLETTEGYFLFTSKIKEVQRLHIIYDEGGYILAKDSPIDSELERMILFERSDVNKIIMNDGFDSPDDFFKHFNRELIHQEASDGRFPYILHWTDLKY